MKLLRRILQFWRIITLLILSVIIYYFFIYEPPSNGLRNATKEDIFNIEEKIEIDENGDTTIVEVWSSGQDKTTLHN